MGLQLDNVVVDCRDALKLADFWAALLGRTVDPEGSEYFATVGRFDPVKATLMFIQVPEERTGKNRIHIDLASDDPEADLARAIELGAERVSDHSEYGISWTTLQDPEGNVFDIAEQPAT